jgi:hypothetical protein
MLSCFSDSVQTTSSYIMDSHFLPAVVSWLWHPCCRLLGLGGGACSRNSWVEAECAKKCAWAKLLPPEPAPYRACLSGCERGAAAGVKLGCEEMSTAESCEAHIKDECEDDTPSEQSKGHCKHLHSEAEGIRNMCRQGCAKGSRSACTRTAEIVERRRKQDISMNEFAEL